MGGMSESRAVAKMISGASTYPMATTALFRVSKSVTVACVWTGQRIARRRVDLGHSLTTRGCTLGTSESRAVPRRAKSPFEGPSRAAGSRGRS